MAKQLISDIPCREGYGGPVIVCEFRIGFISPEFIECELQFAYELGNNQPVSIKNEIQFIVESRGESVISDWR